MDFSCLPLEVLTIILEHLSVPDLKTARLLSSRWYQASLAYSLIVNEKLVVHLGDKSVRCEDVEKSVRDFLHISFDVAPFMSPLKDSKGPMQSAIPWLESTSFWSKVGPQLQTLSFFMCSFSALQLFKVLMLCPKLKSLKIKLCAILESEELEIPDCAQVQPDDISLQLPDEGADGFHETTVNRSKRNGNYVEELQLILDDEQEFFVDQNIPYLLLSLPNLRLRKLDANGTQIVEALSLQQDWLEELKLDFERYIFEDLLCSKLRELRQLEKLTLLFGEESGMQPTCIRSLSSLENLVSVEISAHPAGSSAIQESDVLVGLCSAVNPTMKELKLHLVPNLSERCISEICRTHPALTTLSLFLGQDGVTDIGIQSISYYLGLLESLDLHSCENFTDDGLMGIMFGLPTVEMDGYSFPVGHSLSRLKNLRELSLDYCSGVTGEAFQLGLKLPNLKVVNWHSNKEIEHTHDGMVALVQNHPLIEVLYLQYTSDKLIDAIIENLKFLKCVKIEKHTGSAEKLDLLQERCHTVVSR